MVSDTGDLFEHIRDIASLIFMCLHCCLNYVISRRLIILAVCVHLMTGIHVGCLQKQYAHEHNESLDLLQIMCIDDSVAYWSSFYGVGMYMVTWNLVVIYLSHGFVAIVKLLFMLAGVIYFLGVSKRQNQMSDETNVRNEIDEPEIISINRCLINS